MLLALNSAYKKLKKYYGAIKEAFRDLYSIAICLYPIAKKKF